MKFKVTWPGRRTLIEERSDCATLEQFINSMFGSVSPAEYGVTVEVYSDAQDEQVPTEGEVGIP